MNPSKNPYRAKPWSLCGPLPVNSKSSLLRTHLSRPRWHLLLGVFILFLLCSCDTLKQSSKYQFNEGYYKVSDGKKMEKVYVVTGSDTIKEYKRSALAQKKIDTTKAIAVAFPAQKPMQFTDHSFRQSTFDIDVLTVLFKYRPSAEGFPPQFNTTFNGAVFLGYRTDVYKLSYKQTPLHVYKRSTTHYGYSAGFFTGLGSARIDEYVTNNALSIQYDGLVNLSGLALIVAIDKLTAGLTLGVDHLLDKNKNVWVNNSKPWLGLSLGLNLN